MGHRRVQMTKALIRGALVELMAERPPERIGIAELCRAADVNRSTFYAHYRSVSQVLDEVEAEFAAHVPYVDEERTLAENIDAFAAYLAFCREHRAELQALRGAGRLEGIVAERSLGLALPAGADARLRRMLVDYAVAGTYRALDTWLDGKVDLTAHDAARVILGAALALNIVEQQLVFDDA